jgi:hypothetical protein
MPVNCVRSTLPERPASRSGIFAARGNRWNRGRSAVATPARVDSSGYREGANAVRVLPHGAQHRGLCTGTAGARNGSRRGGGNDLGVRLARRDGTPPAYRPGGESRRINAGLAGMSSPAPCAGRRAVCAGCYPGDIRVLSTAARGGHALQFRERRLDTGASQINHNPSFGRTQPSRGGYPGTSKPASRDGADLEVSSEDVD